MAAPGGSTINLVAIQPRISLDMCADRRTFFDHLKQLFELADCEVGLGPDTLIALPEDIGLLPGLTHYSNLVEYDDSTPLDILTRALLLDKSPLSSDVETVAEALARYIWRHPIEVGWRKGRYRSSWSQAFFLAKQDAMADTYFSMFSDLASLYSSTIVAGTGAFTEEALGRYVPDDVPGAPADSTKHIYNAGATFGPDGDVLGLHRKVNLVDIEQNGLGFASASADDLFGIPWPGGTVGVAVCVDIFDGEVLSRLESEGVDILVQPGAIAGPWDKAQQREWMEGLPKAVQNRPFSVGINPMLTGEVLNVTWQGQSSIVTSPLPGSDETKRAGFTQVEGPGTVEAAADTPTHSEVVTATMHLTPRRGRLSGAVSRVDGDRLANTENENSKDAKEVRAGGGATGPDAREGSRADQD